MALQLGPVPNLNVQTPDYTAKALEGAQLKNMLSEMSLRQSLAPLQVQEAQQRVQQQTTANTLAQMQLESNKKIMEFMAARGLDKFVGKNSGAPEGSAFDATGATAELARQGIMPEVAQPFIQHFQNIDKANAEIAKNYGAAAGDFLNNRAKAHSQLAGSLDDALSSKNPAGIIPSIVARFLRDPQGLSQDEITGLKSLQGMGGDALVKTASAMSAALNLGAEMDRHHAETAKTAAEASRATTEATEAAARATGTVTPQMKTEQQQKLDIATAEARIHAQVQASMLPLIEQIRQGFTNQKDARDKIDSTVLKPYQEAQNNIEMAREMTAQAATNPVAARLAVFKLIGVAQPTGTHRVLPAEVEAAKFPGGLGTRVAEHISDFLNGKPWTPEIQQAVQEVINGQDLASKAALNTGIGNANKLYGTNVGTGLQQSVSKPGAGVTAPKVGTIEDGYRFKGGDPSKASSWEKVAK